MTPVRILLADDHALVRAGIRSLLEGFEGVAIVGEAHDGREAVALARAMSPNIVLMDISMRELNGIDAAAQIRAEVPQARIVMLSMHATEDFVIRALRAGASGYLVKDSAPLELRMAIDAVMRGEKYISSRVSGALVAGVVEGRPSGAATLDVLTPRQREILQLVAEGKGTKEIAFTLELSVKTVETHRAALMERLAIRDVAGLVVFAIRTGLIDIGRPEAAS
jgi:DNA-binding NarL/FixJ family response regulator